VVNLFSGKRNLEISIEAKQWQNAFLKTLSLELTINTDM